MKDKITVWLLLTAFLLMSSNINAQSTLEVSNLGQTAIGSADIASDSLVAQQFRTGDDSGGYILSAIQLLMDAPSGSPSGFTVSIYNSVNGQPGTDLGNLAGSAPTAGGVYTYTTSGITLSTFASYYVVLSSSTPAAQGAFDWSSATSTTGIGRWVITGPSFNSPNGSSWDSNPPGQDIFQMSIYATIIPEPSAYVLGAFGALVLGFYRGRRSCG